MKLFADYERKRRELAERDQEERKRKREQEIEEEETAKAQKEWQKNFEVNLKLIQFRKLVGNDFFCFQESRQNRVDSWQNFKAGNSSKSKSSKKMKMFKPPKNKPESR